jgi:hypothetical protein
LNTTVPQIDAADMTRQRDDLRRRMVLPIDGVEYPVVLDVGIFEHTNINNGNVPAGSYASTLYVVPLTASGGWPSPIASTWTTAGLADGPCSRAWNSSSGPITASGRGPAEQVKWCYKLALKTEQRGSCAPLQLAAIDLSVHALQHRQRLDLLGIFMGESACAWHIHPDSLRTGTNLTNYPSSLPRMQAGNLTRPACNALWLWYNEPEQRYEENKLRLLFAGHRLVFTPFYRLYDLVAQARYDADPPRKGIFVVIWRCIHPHFNTRCLLRYPSTSGAWLPTPA